MKLKGKRIVLTGASLGLGRTIAETFLREGADLLLCARTSGPLEQAAGELRAAAAAEQKVFAQTCDVSESEPVERLIAQALELLGGLDVLVNNAGVYGPKGPSEDVAWDEWRRTVEINLYGVMLPCRSVIPHFKKVGGGKIINLSGGGATAPVPMISAYAASKAAVVRLTETLAEELRGHRIDVNAVAPGPLNTRFLDEVLAAGPERVGAEFHAKALKQRDSGGVSLGIAADLCVYLASADGDGITGKLISAIWDPWANLHERLEDLASGDIYTLRRIVPGDRGKTWGKP